MSPPPSTDEPLHLDAGPDGVIVPVRARPRGKREAVVGIRAGRLLVETRAPAEAGRANEGIRAVLARALGLRRAQVELRSGATSRDKRFRVSGLAAAEVLQRLRPEADG